jgi:hypothetical protein
VENDTNICKNNVRRIYLRISEFQSTTTDDDDADKEVREGNRHHPQALPIRNNDRMRISRQSFRSRRSSLVDIISRAIPTANQNGLPNQRTVVLLLAALLFLSTFLLSNHATHSNIDGGRSTQPTEVASVHGLLRSDASKSNSAAVTGNANDSEVNAPTFSVDFSEAYTPLPFKKGSLSPPTNSSFVVFYNLFIPKETNEAKYAVGVMTEQLGQVASSLRRLEELNHDEQSAVVFYNLIGNPFPPEALGVFCSELHPRLVCQQINYYETASEAVTLQNIHDFCHYGGVQSQSDRDIRVTYIHSKGSYHHTPVNTNWRRELTNAVLHPDCLSPPDDRCNVCGASFFTRFAFIYPGNMFTAKCSYINELLPPLTGGEYERLKTESVVKFLKLRLWGHLNTTLLHDRFDYYGLGRFQLEHWIGSHSSIQPCELHRKNVTLGYMVSGKVNSTEDYSWGMGPRREEVVDEIPEAQKALKSNEDAQFKEYYLLPGNLLKWFTLYGSKGIPSSDSWVWDFFAGGSRWKRLVMKHGERAIDEMVKLSTLPASHSAFAANSTETRSFQFTNDNELLSSSNPPVVVFYQITIPEGKANEAAYALNTQFEVFTKGQYNIVTRSYEPLRNTILYYTISGGDSKSHALVASLCKTRSKSITCRRLDEYKSPKATGETVTQLHNFCIANPSHRVAYVTNQLPTINNKTERYSMQKIRAFTTAATSKMCLKSRDTCNVCGMEFYPLPYQHFRGNMFTASCEYVANLLPPRQFEQSMNSIASEALVSQLETKFTTELLPFTPQNIGLDHYSLEHWIGSHPEFKPCDVAPVQKSWFPSMSGNAFVPNQYASSRVYDFQWALAPRRNSAPENQLSLAKEQEVIGIDGIAFREYFYLAGNLLKWYTMYSKAPPDDSWVWDWYPRGNEWRQGVARNASSVVEAITKQYAVPNQGVPF